jgi:NADH:ubiquinone oxidoreductase subunit 6 (subunit J)
MKGLGSLARAGLAVLAIVLLRLLMTSPSFSGEPAEGITTIAFAEALLIDWSIALVALGALMAMAMIGASYLVRDERLENLIYDLGGEEE